jgi:hypothetical protein
MNATLRLGGQIVCDACCDDLLARSIGPRTDLKRQVDPTVCANCKTDHGATALRLLAGMPVCDPCQNFFRHRPFPLWIKAAMVAVLALVGVSMVFNARFFQAYAAMKRYAACMRRNEVEAAIREVSQAAAYVPECEDIRHLAEYVQGISLLSQSRSAEALTKLTACRAHVPPEAGVDALILDAQCGVAFDNKDYDGFVAAAQALDQQTPNNSSTKAELASAFACKYVQTGDAAFRERSLKCLDEARKLAGNDSMFAKYEIRIRHRLASGEIITAEEFQRKFPNGWNPGKEN